MPSSNLMSALSRQKYTPAVVPVVVAGAIMPCPGVSWEVRDKVAANWRTMGSGKIK